jgi:hypothetical protein
MGRNRLNTELVLCGSACPFEGGEPCPLEQGHDGGHIYWSQTKPNAKRGRNGIWIVDDRGRTLMHATFDGAASAEDICVLFQLSELVKKECGCAKGAIQPGCSRHDPQARRKAET